MYVRNLSPAIDETKLNDLFKDHGKVEKVKKIKDYAFIHYENREGALKAIDALDGQTLDDLKIQVSLAKPQVEKKEHRRGQSGFGALNVNKGPKGARGGMRGGRGMGKRGGGYAGYGGPDYGGGYDEYDMYYAPPAPPRGRARGMPPPRGMTRGGPPPRGHPMRGGMPPLRGGPPVGPRGRGAPARGAPPPRGARGGRGAAGAPKRKAMYGQESPQTKRKYGTDSWSTPPIAQQPLRTNEYYSDDYSGGEWYQDSYSHWE